MMRQLARSPVEVMLGSSKMKRAVVASAACMLALWGGMAALGAEPTRIVDVRVGRHESFDRLVVELERRVDLRRVPGAASDPFVLELDARPLLPHQRLETPFARMGVVVIEAVPGGGRIRVEARPRRVRVFRLREPDRVVLDFADPGPEPFDAPPGTEAVPEREPTPPEEPVRVGEIEPPTPPPLEMAEPNAAPSPPEGEEVSEAGVPGPPVPEEPETPVAPMLPREPEPAPEITEVIEPAGEPSPPPRAWLELFRVSALVALFVLLAAVLGIALLAWYRARVARRRRAAARARASLLAWPRAPETITPEEIAGASDQADVLDRRIDEEVRARMHLEERVTQLQEELKVMRDRLHRVARRGD